MNEKQPQNTSLQPSLPLVSPSFLPNHINSSQMGDGRKTKSESEPKPTHPTQPALTYADILCQILVKLPLSDVARASCVCRTWRVIVEEEEMAKKSFMMTWHLKDVMGKPACGWRDGICFAISHRLVKGDSVASLAVKYSVQVRDVKRLNNMMSDHGIHSRERLLIPISNSDVLVNATCYIELDTFAKREVAVLYLEGEPDRDLLSSPNGVTSNQGKRRMIDSLRRSMQVDDGTVQYYLSVSNGDPRAALSQFSEDLRWERQSGLA